MEWFLKIFYWNPKKDFYPWTSRFNIVKLSLWKNEWAQGGFNCIFFNEMVQKINLLG